MRLNSIKLSGFKSFVEPTQFQLPGQLVGVVGPNGCGKSNIIDAVRWVLGESKASELRGESMQDVIFNGSGLRKPAGRASVELAFDNAAGRAGGPWNRFAEIAVKRVLTRDGTSSYYINNQPVRRRDVQDVFLGTGLGPRAYAIIGQGTISRIIESKPEELRFFLEEAAGVSKYKERRRETENRLKDTRENLTRVEDILRELNANLTKLESQAEVAGRYRGAAAGQQPRSSTSSGSSAPRRGARAGAREGRGRRRGRGAGVADRRAAPCRGRARGDPPVALRGQRRPACGAGRARRGRARREPARGADPLRRRRPAADRPTARRSRAAAARPGSPVRPRRGPSANGVAAPDRRRRAGRRRLRRAHRGARRDRRGAQRRRCARRRRASDAQREVVAGVQQQIQVAAAEMRGVDEQSAQAEGRRDRLLAEEKGLAADRSGDASRPPGSAPPRPRPSTAPREARLAEWQERVPGARRGPARRCRPRRTTRRAAMPSSRARLAALKALQEKVQVEDKLKPWLARHGLESLRRPVDAGADRAGLGAGARGGAARAPRLARDRPARHGARLRRRRAAGAAGVLHHAGRADRQRAPHPAAPDRAAAPRRLRPDRAARRLARGRLHRRPTSTRRSRRARASPTAKSS